MQTAQPQKQLMKPTSGRLQRSAGRPACETDRHSRTIHRFAGRPAQIAEVGVAHHLQDPPKGFVGLLIILHPECDVIPVLHNQLQIAPMDHDWRISCAPRTDPENTSAPDLSFRTARQHALCPLVYAMEIMIFSAEKKTEVRINAFQAPERHKEEIIRTNGNDGLEGDALLIVGLNYFPVLLGQHVGEMVCS